MTCPTRSTMFVTSLIAVALALATAGTSTAAPRVAGPNGGRIVKGPGGTQAEFHVGPDRFARVRALGADLKPEAADNLSATLRVQKPAKARTIAFTRTGGGDAGPVHLISSSPLPADDVYPVALALKSGKKSANIRFTINLEVCGGCKLSEYACICGH